MDERQGRLNTVGALVKKGNLAEKGRVIAAPPIPVIKKVELPTTTKADQAFLSQNKSKIWQLLKPSYAEGDCGLDEQEVIGSLEIIHLSKTQYALSSICWRGAYNTSNAVWVLDKSLQKQGRRILVDEAVNEYDNNGFSSAMKVRGIGDCWSFNEWRWNGSDFVQTSSTGDIQCKGFVGGAWYIELFESNVISALEK